MSHINLSIKKNNQTKPYILVNAEYLNEAWLAEAYDDNTTKIIRQFKCKRFKSCFPALTQCMIHLGEVVEITGSDVERRSVNRLKNRLNKAVEMPNKQTRFWNFMQVFTLSK